MTGGTGAVAPTSVVEEHAVVQRDVENRLRLAMIFVRQLAMLELHRLALRQKGQAHCIWAGSFGGCGCSTLFCFLVSHLSEFLSHNQLTMTTASFDLRWRNRMRRLRTFAQFRPGLLHAFAVQGRS